MEIEIKEIDGHKIPWLKDEDYNKAIFQLRGQLIGIMRPLELYGQKPIVDEIINHVVNLVIDFSLKARGIDKPLIINTRWSK